MNQDLPTPRVVFFAVLLTLSIGAAAYDVPATPEPCSDVHRPVDKYALLCRSPEVWPLLREDRVLNERVRAHVPNADAFDHRQTPYDAAEHSICQDSGCLAASIRADLTWLNAQLDAYPSERAAAAPSARVAKYIELMAADTELASLGFVSNACFFRSRAWHDSMDEGFLQEKLATERRLGMSYDETRSVEDYEADVRRRVIDSHPLDAATCAGLRDRGDLARLDAFQRRVTGNYH